MTPPSPNVQAALTTLRDRWGEAAPRWGGEVVGALAVAPRPVEEAPGGLPISPERAVSTGFRALDAILGLGGLPRAATTALHGEGTSGKTTLALQAVAQAQAIGGIVAYLDLARSLDPVEAVSRGVQLEWLVVLTPDTLAEALSMAAMLLQDRTVDLLLLDLPHRPLSGAGPSAAVLADRFDRLAALARRAGVQLLVLEPPNLPSALAGVLTQVSALRLELSRRAWIRLGRDVVGQRTEVRVSRDRFGPPGRATELRIMYAEGGLRDACMARGELLRETVGRAEGLAVGRVAPAVGRVAPAGLAAPMRLVPAADFRAAARAGVAPPGGFRPAAPSGAVRPSPPLPLKRTPVPADATPPSSLAPPSLAPGSQPGLSALRGGADRSGR
jgi:recA bacterial DNA recombination protein